MDSVVSYRKRRGVEAFMLGFAIALSMAGYLLTHLDQTATLPAQWPWALGILTAIAVGLHLVIRWRIPYADPLILPLVMLLNGLGLAMIHRLDLGSSPVMHSAELQLTWLVVAVAACAGVIIGLRDYRLLQRYPYLLFLLGMILLMLPLMPVLGLEKNGARIWIHLGSYSFQPAELAKLVLTIAFASYLVEKREVLALAGGRFLGVELPRPRDLGPILLMWLASLAVLVFQKDLGTSLLFFGLFVVMLYVATEKPSWPALGTVLFLVGAVGAYFAFDHVQVRVSAWLNPFSDYDRNYQVIQAQFGIAWGGIFGTGWGLGRPNMTPLAKTDFIAAALGEEIGITGLMAIILLYGIIVARGFRAALAAKDPFGKLLAAGLAFVFAIQVFAIIGGVTRLLPLTGLTTPFMSQGGSSLVANWVMIGLLLVITHQVRRPAAAVAAMPMASLEADTTELIDVSSLQPSAPARPGATSSPAPAGADEPTGPLPAVSDNTAPINTTAPVDTTAAINTTAPISAPAPDPAGDETAEVPRVTNPGEES
ncbi:MAG: FtsW/RodA/SpoVE family cell cycle protein [Propionibacteriales bacterium]|nr:FtsW/RodA/SpoVE family cell cycle protein [Propionibacteriales bacterium]